MIANVLSSSLPSSLPSQPPFAPHLAKLVFLTNLSNLSERWRSDGAAGSQVFLGQTPRYSMLGTNEPRVSCPQFIW